MAIPENLKGRFAYHFTSIENLESIIDNGLLSTNNKTRQRISHVDLAEPGIQARRSTMAIPCSPGRFVHDYVPFYFAKKTPMQLGIINRKNIDQPLLVYFAVSIKIIDSLPGVIFSDASANTNISPNFYDINNSHKLENLNWSTIDAKQWSFPDEEIRHQKMAELLIPDIFRVNQIDHMIVWNEGFCKDVQDLFKAKGVICPPITYDGNHYYTNFYEGGRESIITGPVLLKHLTEQTTNEIFAHAGNQDRLPNLATALANIRSDFCYIEELSNIDGLNATYGPHHEDVGAHSRKVANLVLSSQEYQHLNNTDKNILEISAYLHDIGKGPKSRWPMSTMAKADNDHARKSLPMLKRILTESIAKLDSESIRKIVTLVTYDDLIGDIVARGRNKQQFFDIITCDNDVHMLIALGKADMAAINPAWTFIHDQAIENLREEAIRHLRRF